MAAGAGEGVREPVCRLAAQGLPPVAHLHALQGVPLLRAAELRQDDQRAAQRSLPLIRWLLKLLTHMKATLLEYTIFC